MHTCAICQTAIWKTRDVCKGKIGYPQTPISLLFLQCTQIEWKCDDGICKECSGRLITFQGAAKVVERMKRDLINMFEKNKTPADADDIYEGDDCEFEIEQLIEEDIEGQIEVDEIIETSELKHDEFEEELYEEETAAMECAQVKIECIAIEGGSRGDNTDMIVLNAPDWQDADEVIEEDSGEVESEELLLPQRGNNGGARRKQHFPAVSNANYPSKCSECDEVFKNLRGYRTHMKRAHFTGYVCEHCGKVLHTRSGFITHQQNHTDTLTFVCNECGQAFKNKFTLRHHQAWHTGLKPYQCDICPKQFVHYIGLYRHKKTHDVATRRIKCEVCGFMVRTNAHLRRHMARHTGAKPHSCPICGKCFSQAYNMKVHVQEHQEPGSTRQRRLKCKKCSRTFRNKLNYQEHVQLNDCDATSLN